MLRSGFRSVARNNAQCKAWNGQQVRHIFLGASTIRRLFGLFSRAAKEPTDEEIVNDTKLLEELSIKGQLVHEAHQSKVGYWLLTVAGAIFGMIVLGGYTRLTKSGLSMTRWKPIQNVYPKDQAAWEEEFGHYKVRGAKPEFSRVPAN